MQPPSQIDGARVLDWAWSDAPFGMVPSPEGQEGVAIHGLAVCQYDGSSVVYRFSCNGNWKCEQDFDYESVEVAKSELPEQYRHAAPIWHLAERIPR